MNMFECLSLKVKTPNRIIFSGSRTVRRRRFGDEPFRRWCRKCFMWQKCVFL